MASNINAAQIDIYYPIAGQDNDTQGFRTNFQNIQTGLATAATEITALQANVAGTPQISSTPPISLSSPGTPGYLAYNSGNLFVCTGTSTWIQLPSAAAQYSNANVASYLPTYSGSMSNVSVNTLTLSNAIQFANLTTAQVNSISTPARGMTVYNYTSGNIQVYNGTKWANVTLS